MPKGIITVHMRFTEEQHAELKKRKGDMTWEEYFFELAGYEDE